VAAFDALGVGLDRVLQLSFDVLTTPERLAMLTWKHESTPRPSWPGWAATIAPTS
jgi:hypothetical protein